jgi:flagellar basal-body rod protein FlgF
MPEIKNRPPFSVKKPIAVVLSMQEAEWQNLTTISNNISNTFNPGYKATKLKFKEMIYKTKDGERISYVNINGVTKDFTDGSIKQTSNPLDVALTGDGFFGVMTKKGLQYTRNGQFTVDNNGQLIMSCNGLPVANDGGGQVSIPPTVKNVAITNSGDLMFDGIPSGKLGVFSFKDNQALKAEGDSLFSSRAEAAPAKDYKVTQYALEESNVSTIKETLRMMESLRNYESAQKVINQHEELLKRTMEASARNA